MIGHATGRTMTSRVRAIALLLATVAVALAWRLLPPTPHSQTFAPTSWNELVPRDWDPLARYRHLDFSRLDDADPRTAELLRAMREAWNNAPINSDLDGRSVVLSGYVVPLEDPKQGLKEFLLVPYFGACIHAPPPPANQIVHVVVAHPIEGLGVMDVVRVSGTLDVLRQDSAMGMSAYRLQALVVERRAAAAGP